MSAGPGGWSGDQVAGATVSLLETLGFTFFPAEVLDTERKTFAEPLLPARLAASLDRLNPWLSSDNIQRVVRTLSQVQADSLVEANEKVYSMLARGLAIEQDRGGGRKAHAVRLFDFATVSKNDFAVTSGLRLAGAKKEITLDVVVYVNGIPLSVIVCAAPGTGETWLDESVGLLQRYQELGRENRELGAPKIFETVQFAIATCGLSAAYGAVGASRRFYSDWKIPFPLTGDEIGKRLGRRPHAQDILLYGMLEPANLLDLLRSFVTFDTRAGRRVRRAGRCKQYLAVSKAVERIKGAQKPDERGGVIWHAQGSGKCVTLLFLATKLRRDPALGNSTVLVVCERPDLEQQLAAAFARGGLPPPDLARSVRDLRDWLVGPPGRTILTSVQKFQEVVQSAPARPNKRGRKEPSNAVSVANDLIVLFDDANRVQNKGLFAGMRRSFPNACFVGFTGTPIGKQDRSILSLFGPFIDTYSFEQAIADDATVPLYYEARVPYQRIMGQSLDRLFYRIFADKTDKEQEALRRTASLEEAIASAPRRVDAVCRDLISHYATYVKPAGFKGQVVTISRDAALAFKEALDRLSGPESALVISVGFSDPRYEPHRLTREQLDRVIERFNDPGDSLSLLVVCDTLLSGFDAPICQALYLDAPLKDHGLLQTVARVNRKLEGKTYGLVVDYWGVTDGLTEALGIFIPGDVKGALYPKPDELVGGTGHGPAAQMDGQAGAFEEAYRQYSKFLDKATKLEDSIRQAAQNKHPQNPPVYESVQRRLEALIQDRIHRRVDDAQHLALLAALALQMDAEGKSDEGSDLSPLAQAIFVLLGDDRRPGEDDEAHQELATLLHEALEPHLSSPDWARRDDIQQEMRQRLRKQLRVARYDPARAEDVSGRILELARARSGR
jgi:type I restriction enzyme R subunit